MSDLTEAQQAAYAKGLEDAAQVADGFTDADHIASDMRRGIFPQRSSVRSAVAAVIRALSPLPPGSRVVVVPPKDIFLAALREAFEVGAEQGSDEATAFDWGSRPSQSRDEAFADILAEWNTIGLENIRAALRALTGGDDRG